MLPKLLLTTCLICMGLLSFGQANPFDNPNMTDAFSRPLYLHYNYIAEGSPYLFDDYTLSEITLENGKSYSDIKVKFNLIDREVVFKDDKGQELVVIVPIKSIRFLNSIVDGVPHTGTVLEGLGKSLNAPDSPVYEIIADGKARLMKHIVVSYTDNKKYGEANITRTFKRKLTYYALVPGATELKKLEKNKTEIAALFGKQQGKIYSYIESNNLKCKSDEDLKKVFDFYNSLQ